ncbi:DUF2268 domain-containing putative Zn-dependent protease [Streptomyces sp. ICBB 8177]|uniref:DUF2268 domain-containing putative Zn-dependent protease n=1 Tax=Streptomyces sp. ICBB 8177 TaxID=563922 RepID=UPI0023B126E0|nr:DUF2268 domain-containing putative Zn-dependent protease [Streptomyces sp. ICBB 8177]
MVAEGLAEAFVRELAGEQPMGPWSRNPTGGGLDRACERVTTDITNTDVAGMRNLTACVLSDTTAHRTGQPTVGLPDFADHPGGPRIVDPHLATIGPTAAASTALPAQEILPNAVTRSEA